MGLKRSKNTEQPAPASRDGSPLRLSSLAIPVPPLSSPPLPGPQPWCPIHSRVTISSGWSPTSPVLPVSTPTCCQPPHRPPLTSTVLYLLHTLTTHDCTYPALPTVQTREESNLREGLRVIQCGGHTSLSFSLLKEVHALSWRMKKRFLCAGSGEIVSV